ncbi:MAG: TdeIII family type II restriction endonuclease [Verrucomicrobiae bacterium]|nr:TdeIII family type II restriction endonuclease [Verrucomicrobiae bacterium]
MPIKQKLVEELRMLLTSQLRRKLAEYNPEPHSMPFHTRLLGADRMALFSFIHSLSTNFGAAIFEPVAVAVAKTRFRHAVSQAAAGDCISKRAHEVIQEIMDGLATAVTEPDLDAEVRRLRAVCQLGTMSPVKLTRVDLMLESQDGVFYLFDLKTAKPNAGNFREFKRTLLEWTAAFLARNPKVDVRAAIAIPYNPYEPKPYNRWTMRGMIDLRKQLYVGKEFWDFLGGDGAYEQLLGVFEAVGVELKPEIDARFAQFK